MSHIWVHTKLIPLSWWNEPVKTPQCTLVWYTTSHIVPYICVYYRPVTEHIAHIGVWILHNILHLVPGHDTSQENVLWECVSVADIIVGRVASWYLICSGGGGGGCGVPRDWQMIDTIVMLITLWQQPDNTVTEDNTPHTSQPLMLPVYSGLV